MSVGRVLLRICEFGVGGIRLGDGLGHIVVRAHRCFQI